MRSSLSLDRRRLTWLTRVAPGFLLALVSASPAGLAAESAPLPAAASQVEQTNAPEVLQTFLQLQETLRATQFRLEQSRREAREAAAQNVEALSNGLQAIHATLAAARARDLEARHRSDDLLLLVLGTVGAMGLLALLMLTYFQWRTSQALAEISATFPALLGLGPGSAVTELGPGEEPQLGPAGALAPPTEASQPPARSSESAVKPRRTSPRSIERRLFPNPGDSFRRRQFRALKVALFVGLLIAAMVALLLYLVSSHRSS
jgi:hypothetical protein